MSYGMNGLGAMQLQPRVMPGRLFSRGGGGTAHARCLRPGEVAMLQAKRAKAMAMVASPARDLMVAQIDRMLGAPRCATAGLGAMSFSPVAPRLVSRGGGGPFIRPACLKAPQVHVLQAQRQKALSYPPSPQRNAIIAQIDRALANRCGGVSGLGATPTPSGSLDSWLWPGQGGGVSAAGADYQKQINAELKMQGYATISEDGKLGSGTCGAVELLNSLGIAAPAPKNCYYGGGQRWWTATKDPSGGYVRPVKVGPAVNFDPAKSDPIILQGQKLSNIELGIMGMQKIAEDGLLSKEFCGAVGYLLGLFKAGEGLGDEWVTWTTTYGSLLSAACEKYFTPPYPAPQPPKTDEPKKDEPKKAPKSPFDPKKSYAVIKTGQKLLNIELKARNRTQVKADGYLKKDTCAGFNYLAKRVKAGEKVSFDMAAWFKKHGNDADLACSILYGTKYTDPKALPKKEPVKEPVKTADTPKTITSCKTGYHLSADHTKCVKDAKKDVVHADVVTPPAPSNKMPLILLGVGAVALLGAVVYAKSKKATPKAA